MMLPSGNDAAQTISENLGKLLGTQVLAKQEPSALSELCRQPKTQKTLIKQGTAESFTNTAGVSQKTKMPKKGPLNKPFLERMNKLAESLGMVESTYCNPHGLMNKFNTSTAVDIAKLLSAASKSIPGFIEVISMVQHTAQVYRRGESDVIEWTNTHKSIDDPRFIGGKTGITVAAGPCLATLKKIKGEHQVAIVLLNCIFCSSRFKRI